jgi:inosine-uridine nucleoside N-ribohydrolase
LWFTFAPPAAPDSTDATAFYCTTLRPGLLVVTLGPLTNIARAMESCPANWQGVEIVSVGGGKFTHNQTPVSEYNFWQDPEAAAQVLSHTASRAVAQPMSTTLQIVLADAFTQFGLTFSDLDQMTENGVPAIRNLAPALEIYMQVLSAGGETPTFPDPAAAIYALQNMLGGAHSALVDVLAGVPEVARGQTVVGLGQNEKIVMIAGDAVLSDLARRFYNGEVPDFEAELRAILASRPDNALAVTGIEARRIHSVFMQGLHDRSTSTSSEDGDAAGEIATPEDRLFVPYVSN